MSAPSELQIRRMAAADLPRIRESAENLENVPRWPPAAWLAVLNPDAAPRRIALVAVHPVTGGLNGFAVAALLPPQAELETIAVIPEARRQGIGSSILGALLGELAQAGIAEIFLEVRVSNRTALSFYQAHGFAESGRRARYYADPIEDAVLMSRVCRESQRIC